MTWLLMWGERRRLAAQLYGQTCITAPGQEVLIPTRSLPVWRTYERSIGYGKLELSGGDIRDCSLREPPRAPG